MLMIYATFTISTVIGSYAEFGDDFYISVCYSRNNLNDRGEDMTNLQQDQNYVAETSACWNLKLNIAECLVMR